jgi:Fe-S-cluster-containing hydrogenase component 2
MRKIFIDCPQEIPCDPCESSCPTGAIVVEGLICRPGVNPELCIACGNCVQACPGQACFLIDEDYSDTEATIEFPFEFLPLPVKGEIRQARDNEGNTICLGEVIDVKTRPVWQNTVVVRLAVPKENVFKVRGMARQPEV